jgi:hypothetical protein
MLPFEKPWFRKLLLLAPVIGAAAGVLALIFMGITGTASGFFFGGMTLFWMDDGGGFITAFDS